VRKQKIALTVVCASACGQIFSGGEVELTTGIQGQNSIGRLDRLNEVPFHCVEILGAGSIFVANPTPRYFAEGNH
jgi:hypothetical protein